MGSSAQNYLVKGKQLMGVENSHEWSLSDWRWDGNRFIAKPANTVVNDCRTIHLSMSNMIGFGTSNSSSLHIGEIGNENSVHANGNGNGNVLSLEKRKRAVPDRQSPTGDASLTLNLGGNLSMSAEEEVENGNCNGELRDGKRSKPPLPANNSPTCQVDGCKADLHDVKEYHRRHKVCERHAKSSTVTVGGITQRFCQQCSRFHKLQEFDEGKRSCRRRLAGHNRRRRKANLDVIAGAMHPLDDERISRFILVNILKILSDLHATKLEQKDDHDLLFQLLKLLAGSGGTSKIDLSAQVRALQPHQDADSSTRIHLDRLSAVVSNAGTGLAAPDSFRVLEGSTAAPAGANSQQLAVLSDITQSIAKLTKEGEPCNSATQNGHASSGPMNLIWQQPEVASSSIRDTPGDVTWENAHAKIKDFDLNSIYIDDEDHSEETEKQSPSTSSDMMETRLHAGPSDCPVWGGRNTSPQTSAISESNSDKSLSSSGGDVPYCTARIIVKLFGKQPSDLPHLLRPQILDWLSQSPTDIESHIRPGCVVLTVYLRLPQETWEELLRNLADRLFRLFKNAQDEFWKNGWICVKADDQLAFIYNGLALDRTFSFTCRSMPMIRSVTPIAVAMYEEATFRISGVNLRGIKRLCIAFQGDQVVQENVFPCDNEDEDAVNSISSLDCCEEIQFLTFTCSLPESSGRGFIEIEDNGLSSSYMPFIVAEHDVCSEICELEILMEDCTFEQSEERDHVVAFIHEFGWLLERTRLTSQIGVGDHQASDLLNLNIKWLLEYSVERDWCAVVRKILDILYSQRQELDEDLQNLLDDVALLHTAVRRKYVPMVKFLMQYAPQSELDTVARPLFRVDNRGPAGLTALHIAATIDDAESVLDALTNGPEKVWAKTWDTCKDSNQCTPEDYALQGGRHHYNELIKRKKSKKPPKEYVSLDMPNIWMDEPKEMGCSFAIDIAKRDQCKPCKNQYIWNRQNRLVHSRAAVISMVAVATVCVCVGILMKSALRFTPGQAFKWENLDFGSI